MKFLQMEICFWNRRFEKFRLFKLNVNMLCLKVSTFRYRYIDICSRCILQMRCILDYDKIIQFHFITYPLIKATQTSNFETKNLVLPNMTIDTWGPYKNLHFVISFIISLLFFLFKLLVSLICI